MAAREVLGITMTKLTAPFPYFGGKRKVASIVWQALGDPAHYLEPFFGSGAVLLARENWVDRLETVCDADGWICNLWRALQFNPEEVAKYADWPVNHNDLNARRKTLKDKKEVLTQKLDTDPYYYDAELAGYWIWGQCCGIAAWSTRVKQMPEIGTSGKGIHVLKHAPIRELFTNLQNRLRKVRVVCGDWTKICGGNWQNHFKSIGYFFDPPYSGNREKNVYAIDSLMVASELSKFCLLKGGDSNWRIVLAGYNDAYPELLNAGWFVYCWKAQGGYSRKGKQGEINKQKEALFFSPHCLKVDND